MTVLINTVAFIALLLLFSKLFAIWNLYHNYNSSIHSYIGDCKYECYTRFTGLLHQTTRQSYCSLINGMPFQFITQWLLPALEALPGEHICQQHTWVLWWTGEGTSPHTWTTGRMLYQQASCFKHLPNFSKSKVKQSLSFLIYP